MNPGSRFSKSRPDRQTEALTTAIIHLQETLKGNKGLHNEAEKE